MKGVKVINGIVRKMSPNIKNNSPAIRLLCDGNAKYSTKACDAKNEKESIATLPKLPVPKLKETLNTYLQTVKPFINNQECENTEKLLADFECKDGKKLQCLLEERAKSLNNWLSDWWLDTAYLTYRDPVVIFSSPGQIFPKQTFACLDAQLEYAAKVIVAAIDFKIKIDNDKIPQEKMGKDLLDMSQYKKVFGTCRQPFDKKDKLVFNLQSKHIVVVSNNFYYKLPVQNEKGAPFSVKQIKEQLKNIRADSCGKRGTPIGILSALNRDDWACAYQKLKSIGIQNERSIDAIETSLFLMCLDNALPNPNNLSAESLGAHQLIHGGASKGNINNRWFDKTMQFVVSEDGINGITYEHSPSEGQPIATLTDYIVEFIKQDLSKGVNCAAGVTEICPLKFETNAEIDTYRQKACDFIDRLISDLSIHVNVFTDYGKNYIKSQKLSPDSFFQMAIQLAFYRIHQTPGAHYESASLRKFIDGRTEAIRSCSIESIKFAKIMLDPEQSNSNKVIALREAVNSHKNYVAKAINGKGCDRHLLGLKLLALENKLPLHELYKDVAFLRSSTFRLSTSQVASMCYSFMSYGPLVPNGYGCCYNVRDNDLIMACSSFSTTETNVNNFSDSLTQSLRDMKNVLESETTKAKL